MEPTTAPEPKLQIRRASIDSLRPDPANARTHNEANLAAIEASLRRFGQVEPLVISAATKQIVGGHGRLAAMRSLGWAECDVVEVDLNSIDATALGIALNRSAELATWDEETLTKLLASLRDEGALDGVGFSDNELNVLLAQFDTATNDVNDVAPEDPPEVPISRLGDLWVLGDHRLLCGDSTRAEDVARLMNGERAHLCASDPPYLVNYDGANHPPSSVNRPETANHRWDEYKDPATSVAFFKNYLELALAHCVEDVPIYQWHATRRQVLVEQAWTDRGLLVHQSVIWVKSRAVLTRSMLMWRHEPCFFGWPQGSMPPKNRRPPPNETTVWEVDQIGQQDGIHPTQKPTQLFERPIQWHTRAGEICYEPFSGSGTQIIAAEKLRRRCYAMELAPGFVDVAVKRWMKATGKMAMLNDKSFDEVAEARCGERA
jgi:DNA modification methylase